MPHDFEMPLAYVDRALAREGRAHSVDRLDGAATALIAVDMQRYFMEDGFAGASPWGPGIVPNVNRLADSVRSADGTVVWLQMEAPAEADDWSVLRRRHSAASEEARWGSLGREGDGFELWPELDIRSDDLRVVKTRYSAFITGSSELESQLRSSGIDTLLIAGVATNVCCESTARDAMMLDFRVVMISDSCAAASDQEHAGALGSFYLFFGDVQTTEEIIALL